MTPTLLRPFRPGSDPVELRRLRTLGKLGGATYVEHRGNEYALVGSVVDDPRDLAPIPGSIIVSWPKPPWRDDATGAEMAAGSHYQAAEPLPAGSYAREAARAARRSAPAASRPLDALAALTSLAARPPRIFGGGSGAAAPAIRPVGSMTDGRPPIRGRALLGYLSGRGVTLSVVGGRLLASAPAGHAGEDVRRLLELAAPLLLGYVNGHPLGCELPGHDGDAPEAVTVTAPGLLAMCEAHRTGEVTA